MVVHCAGCKREFKNMHGLQIHRSRCAKFNTELAELGRNYKERVVLKVACQQGRDVGEERQAARSSNDNEAPGPSDHPTALEAELASAPEPALVEEPFIPPPTSSGRVRRFPRHFADFLPSLATHLPHLPPRPQRAPSPKSPVISDREPTPDPVEIDPPTAYETEPDDFGIYRVYTSRPSYDPESLHTLASLCEGPEDGDSNSRAQGIGSNYGPFRNETVLKLMLWVNNGNNTKSIAEIDKLVNDVILAEGFNVEDLRNGPNGKFSTQRENERIDQYAGGRDSDEGPETAIQDGWKEGTVVLRLPHAKDKFASEKMAPALEIKGIWHRCVVDVLRSAFAEVSADYFHLQPFKMYWRDPDDPDALPVRLISELYNADAFLEEHSKIATQPGEPGCELEKVIAAIMLSSDATHLASFGNASLWPIYMYLGNLSKYSRGKPTSFAAHHIAYIPSLPDTVQDVYKSAFGEGATASTLTFLKRDLMQSIWTLLLDDLFVDAYVQGIEIKCADGIVRRVYPRIFTYSADYPEKALLATIKTMGRFPCPDCLVEMDQIPDMGTKHDAKRRRDKARKDTDARQRNVDLTRLWIYQMGDRVGSNAIEKVLGPTSEVPIKNAFSDRLFKHGFDFYRMFVPDQMHEFELGVWKATFTHLIRILYANGGNSIQDLNTRYRNVPTFGSGTIRKFSENASGMKKLAARDFEDLLQCAIPVFEGLLPAPHDAILINLLFVLATWHAYAKLRLHTEHTLDSLERATSAMGTAVRHFAKTTCKAFTTLELPRDEAPKGRRKAALMSSGSRNVGTSSGSQKVGASGNKQRRLNLLTYKFHRMGDYVESIRRFGTTDNFSTQTGELEHRRVKHFYKRTNKHNFTQQVTAHQRRERVLINIQAAMEKVRIDDGEALPYTPPSQRFHISDSNKHSEDLASWLRKMGNDPAAENFVSKLKDHLLGRVRGRAYEGDEIEYSEQDRNRISFVYNRIYQHQVMRLNYTTYDLRRSQDSINARTHGDVMVISSEDDDNAHPYWYARVIGIFHADVRYRNPQDEAVDRKSMEFLWVRWFGRDPTHRSGLNARRLPRIGFVPSDDNLAFGFLSPEAIVRAAHLIPAFAHGRTEGLLPYNSRARQPSEGNSDWQYYYVNIFVDRDMFMRYSGEGMGHRSTRRAVGNALSRNGANLHYEMDDSEWFDEDDVFVVPQTNGDDLRSKGSESDDSEGGDGDGHLDSDWEQERYRDSDDDNLVDVL